MAKRVPKFIAEIYGSAHRFRANKRKLVRRIEKLTMELRRGAAYFPDVGYKDVERIADAARSLKKNLSVRRWGR